MSIFFQSLTQYSMPVLQRGVFLVLILPLVVTPYFFQPFISGKAILLRIVIDALIFPLAWILATDSRARKHARHPIIICLALGIAVSFISNILSPQPETSFFGTFERMDGWITHVHLLLYGIMLTVSLRTTREWCQYMFTSLMVSTIVVLLGILQHFGFDPLTLSSYASDPRMSTTIGNAGIFSQYVLLHVFLLPLMFIEPCTTHISRLTSICILTVSAPTLLLGLFLSDTRGAILGLGLGLWGACVMYWVGSRYPIGRRISLTALIGTWTMLFLLPFFIAMFPTRMPHFETTRNVTIESRLTHAHMAWEGIKEKPILGWGDEGYAIVSERHFASSLYQDGLWFDRAHSMLLDVGVTRGILGMFLLCVFYIILIRKTYALHSYFHTSIILMGGIMAYVGMGLTWFESFIPSLSWMVLVMYVVHLSTDKTDDTGSPPTLSPQPHAIILLTAFTLCLVVSVALHLETIERLRFLALARSPHPSGIEENLKYLNHVLAEEHPQIREARFLLYNLAMAVLSHPNSAEQLKFTFFEQASIELQKEVARSPYDGRAPYMLGNIHSIVGDHSHALLAFQLALQISPNKLAYLSSIAHELIMLGRTEEAQGVLRTILSREPDYPLSNTLLEFMDKN